jgi:hypothetical protein
MFRAEGFPFGHSGLPVACRTLAGMPNKLSVWLKVMPRNKLTKMVEKSANLNVCQKGTLYVYLKY